MALIVHWRITLLEYLELFKKESSRRHALVVAVCFVLILHDKIKSSVLGKGGKKFVVHIVPF